MSTIKRTLSSSLDKLHVLNVKFLLVSIYGLSNGLAGFNDHDVFFGNNDYNQTVVPYFYIRIIFAKLCKYRTPILF